jgi:hypothetical protein
MKTRLDHDRGPISAAEKRQALEAIRATTFTEMKRANRGERLSAAQNHHLAVLESIIADYRQLELEENSDLFAQGAGQ